MLFFNSRYYNKNMKLRYARDSDMGLLIEGKERISAIEKWPEKYVKAGESVIHDYRRAIAEKRIRVVEKDGEPVAFLYFRPGFEVMYMKEYGNDRNYLWIQRIYVKESERGKGLARMLYDDAARIARGMGLSRIVCDVFDINGNSVKAHKRMGFRPVYSIYERDV